MEWLARYNRVIAWCSVTRVSNTWVEQSRPGSVLVVPMLDHVRPRISKYRRSKDGGLVEEDRFEGGFIPATAAPFRPWESDSQPSIRVRSPRRSRVEPNV